LIVCADQQAFVIPIKIVQGHMDSVYVQFDTASIAAGFESTYAFGREDEILIFMPQNVIPGYYAGTLQLGTPRCPVPDVPILLQIQYASSVIAQKDGLIALLNDDYNGGYQFDAYQWYRNGEKIEGADLSYIIVGKEDIGAQYSVVLTRSTDGVTIPACPVTYGRPQTIDETFDNSAWMLMDIMGRVIVPLSDSNNLQTVTTPGVYVLVNPSAHKTAKIIIR
jgi:hypothetical protein